jgi:hypothetical protein
LYRAGSKGCAAAAPPAVVDPGAVAGAVIGRLLLGR